MSYYIGMTYEVCCRYIGTTYFFYTLIICPFISVSLGESADGVFINKSRCRACMHELLA